MVTELLHSDMTQIVKEPSFLNGVVVLLRFLFVVIRFVTFWSMFYLDWETDRKSTRLNSSHRL